MRAHYNSTPDLTGAVVAIGAFDGVHRGHQKVILQAVQRSKELMVPSLVYTFDPPPRSFFQGAKVLTTVEEKVSRIAALGVDHIVVANFDQSYINRTADSFIEELTRFSPKEINVGRDFRFGKNRFGDVTKLSKHFHVNITKAVCCAGGDTISSTRIRKLLLQGEHNEAALLLGWEQPSPVS
ncbi:FAD synthetase family protein [Thalassobacillus devorans]|uniref:FAD synthetase family protein n=1 Tax=Thalassobacillus devorans TaxID=279813 RepID=UPI00048AFC42|nr:FAD synthetase family protein [Thalassobacillus devorans]